MPSVYPDFYTRFACRADRCEHSCCRGWEIDVDAASAAYYHALPGPLGEALRAALEEDDGEAHFRLDAEERCPFLQPDGLCRLIRELGEDALCDICALHPRFFSDCGDWELCGLGLSCEAAAALLLESGEPLRFCCEGETFSFPQLLERLGILCPEEALRFVPPSDGEVISRLLAAYAETEAIDENWIRELNALASAQDRLLAAGREQAPRVDTSRYNRILSYLLYRQLDRLEEYGFDALLRYAQDAAAFLFLQDVLEADLAGHLRRWSEQIEYSTENVDRLLRLRAESFTAPQQLV